jgi:hypothetical protein
MESYMASNGVSTLAQSARLFPPLLLYVRDVAGSILPLDRSVAHFWVGIVSLFDRSLRDEFPPAVEFAF